MHDDYCNSVLYLDAVYTHMRHPAVRNPGTVSHAVSACVSACVSGTVPREINAARNVGISWSKLKRLGGATAKCTDGKPGFGGCAEGIRIRVSLECTVYPGHYYNFHRTWALQHGLRMCSVMALCQGVPR